MIAWRISRYFLAGLLGMAITATGIFALVGATRLIFYLADILSPFWFATVIMSLIGGVSGAWIYHLSR